MAKAEYITPSGKKVTIEIVTSKVIGHDDWHGDVIEPCWDLRIDVDGKNYKYQDETAVVTLDGQPVNAICVWGGKIVVPDTAWPAVKAVLDAYTVERKRRSDAAAAAEKEYQDNYLKVTRAIGE